MYNALDYGLIWCKATKTHGYFILYNFRTMVQGDTLLSIKCIRCEEGFKPNEDMLNQNGVYYHNSCFVCEQCFRPFCGELDSDVYELQGNRLTSFVEYLHICSELSSDKDSNYR